MEDKYHAGVLCTAENHKQRVTLKEGDVIRQRFTAEDNMLGGLGVFLKIKESPEADGSSKGDEAVQGDPVLTWKVLERDRGDTVLSSGECSFACPGVYG